MKDEQPRSLIVTGWGRYEYAGAAALALRRMPEADVVGLSVRRLPEFLGEERATGYGRILILGVGLTGDLPRLAAAVEHLAQKDVRLDWVSAFPPPPEIPTETRRRLNPFVGKEGGDLLDAVAAFLKQTEEDLDDLREVLRQPKTKGRRPSKDVALSYPLFLEAAMYAHRNHQDETTYREVIRHLAKKDGVERWSKTETKLVDYYRRYGYRELIGESAAMEGLRTCIKRVAPHDHARVLIFGESGTGKEMIAYQVHYNSPRRAEPYVAFNCASVNPSLLESRFLGYEKGAFTGANECSHGLFEQADGGTLFLDEIGEMPLEVQGTLLRILEVGRFARMGGSKEVEVDVRLIAATHRDLARMVRDGKFREDLFYRLNVVQISVPPLREHKEDIVAIANTYWFKQQGRRLTTRQIGDLQSYDYPGNVRELLNILERASVFGGDDPGNCDFGGLLDAYRRSMASLLPTAPERASASPGTEGEAEAYPENLDAMTCLHVKRVYAKYGFSVGKAAAALGIAPNTVKKWIRHV